MPATIDYDSLPTSQFTAGSVAKATGQTVFEVRAALDKLVDAGRLTVKAAKSGARNYSRVKGDKAAKPAAKKAAAETSPSTDRVERMQLAKSEAKALKAWEKAGEQGVRPATPNLDAINAGTQPAKAPRTRKTTGESGGATRGTSVQFLHDGKTLPASQNKLSSVAWYYTKGIGGEDVARISVTELRDLLAKAGVVDPSHTADWSVTLPNGVVISTMPLG